MMVVSVLISRPELTVAQGMAESKMNPYAIGRHGERGAFQVIERHWGKVPKDIQGQQRQNERIMDELLQASGGSLHGALRRYNGSGKAARRYANRVAASAIRVAILGRC